MEPDLFTAAAEDRQEKDPSSSPAGGPDAPARPRRGRRAAPSAQARDHRCAGWWTGPRGRPGRTLVGHPLGPARAPARPPSPTSSPRPPTSVSSSCRRSPRASRRSGPSSSRRPSCIRGCQGKETVLFLDEIHRFSKAQQDSLLPAVENRWVTLIAATTENPVLLGHLPAALPVPAAHPGAAHRRRPARVCCAARSREERGLGGAVSLPDDAEAHLLRIAGGDAAAGADRAGGGGRTPRSPRATEEKITLGTVGGDGRPGGRWRTTGTAISTTTWPAR